MMMSIDPRISYFTKIASHCHQDSNPVVSYLSIVMAVVVAVAIMVMAITKLAYFRSY